MSIKLETKSAFTVVGLKYRGTNEKGEIPALWGQFMPQVPQIKNIINPQLYFGACAMLEEGVNEFDYLACVQVSDEESVPEGMEKWEIPANTYAIFPCTMSDISAAYERINGHEFKNVNLELASGPCFEFYDETFDAQDPNSLLYLYIPVTQN